MNQTREMVIWLLRKELSPHWCVSEGPLSKPRYQTLPYPGVGVVDAVEHWFSYWIQVCPPKA